MIAQPGSWGETGGVGAKLHSPRKMQSGTALFLFYPFKGNEGSTISRFSGKCRGGACQRDAPRSRILRALPRRLGQSFPIPQTAEKRRISAGLGGGIPLIPLSPEPDHPEVGDPALTSL
jgi:hypothetical protein